MHSPQTRATLERCRSVLEMAKATDERQLGLDLVRYMLKMQDEGRLNHTLLLLALDSLELVPGLEDCVAELRATASRQVQG